jgi:hypothetical protein
MAKSRYKLTKKDRVYLEPLAKLLHESGRQAVEEKAVVNKVPGQPFYEWDELTPEAQEGRYLMAAFISDRRRRPVISAAVRTAEHRSW